MNFGIEDVRQESQSLWIAARCLDKSSLQNLSSLLAKHLVLVLTWSCSMIGVILIFQAYASRTLACEQALCLGKKKSRETGFFTLSPIREPFHRLVEDISLTLSSSLRTLIHARKHANKLLIQCGSANQEFTDDQRPQKWTKGGTYIYSNTYSGLLLPSLPNPPPFFPFSLSPTL